jgi:hypothetical protein
MLPPSETRGVFKPFLPPVPVLAAGARLAHAYPVLCLCVGGAPQIEEVVLHVELLRQGVPVAAQ